jgi:hypothetical protein
MVEASLVFAIFALLLIAAFDFAQFLFVHQALVERARFAARWGAIRNPADSDSIQNMILYNRPDSPPDGTPTYFGLSRGNVLVGNTDRGTDNYRINVRISGYTYKVISPLMAGTYTGPPILVSVPLGLYN